MQALKNLLNDSSGVTAASRGSDKNFLPEEIRLKTAVDKRAKLTMRDIITNH